MWRYIKVWKAIWRYMKAYECIWRYVKVYKSIWTHLFDIFVFQLFEGLPWRHCLFLLFWGSTCSTLFFAAFLKVYRPREVSHVLGPHGARIMIIFVKQNIHLAKVEFSDNHGWKERWQLYRIVLSKYKSLGFLVTLCGYHEHTLYTLYNQYTLVISVAEDLRFGLSASKMTSF